MARKNNRTAPAKMFDECTQTLAGDVLDLGSWFVLRMASLDTLPIVRNLNDAGFRVWTPVEQRTSRMPRSKVRITKDVTIMPSYAFAWVDDLDGLLSIAMKPTKPHGRFSVFHHKGGIPLIADSQLVFLRNEEKRLYSIFDRLRMRGKKAPALGKGQVVRMDSGPFEGLSGVVEGVEGQHTLVNFAGFHAPIKIASLLLLPDAVRAELAHAA